jgi:hypothetical protein
MLFRARWSKLARASQITAQMRAGCQIKSKEEEGEEVMKYGLTFDARLSIDPIAIYTLRESHRKWLDSLALEGAFSSAISVDADSVEQAMAIARDELERSDIEIPGFAGEIRIDQVRFARVLQRFAGEWETVWSSGDVL